MKSWLIKAHYHQAGFIDEKDKLNIQNSIYFIKKKTRARYINIDNNKIENSFDYLSKFLINTGSNIRNLNDCLF